MEQICCEKAFLYLARYILKLPVVFESKRDCSLVNIEIQWILDDASLAKASTQWCALPYVAMDTEFMRVDTFYPIAGLIQVGDGQQVWLIDPLLIQDWTPLAQLLAAPSVVKVLHACSEDLEVFQRLTATLPTPLFDTQLAAAYLNLGFSLGYSKLVNQILGLELPKGETRSDWLRRPLSETQVRYAAEDVQHLAELYLALSVRLPDEKRAWLLEDGVELVCQLSREVDPQKLYEDVKQAWRLRPQQLAVLRTLTAWREQQARTRNQPRNRILRENTLWALARYQPKDLGALGRLEDMHPKTIRQDGTQLLALIQEAQAQPCEAWPEMLPEPLPIEASEVLKKLKAVAQAEATRLDIAPELAAKRKMLEALVKTGYPQGHYQLPDALKGWRRDQIGAALLAALETTP